MRIVPFGAAREVTGSCHLLLAEGRRVLLDCGMFQGREEAKNHGPFGFDPRGVEAVVLTHAHLDHVGRLPKLFREGFRGPVYATRATGLLMRIVLEDALKVMEEPPFSREDVEEALAHLEPLEYGEWLRLGDLTLAFGQAGHLPGSAFVVAQGEGKTLVYSGDLGNRQKTVLPDPSLPPKADFVVCEGTYGDRPHRPFPETVREFLGILEETLGQGGKVFIPSFAVERAQEVLFLLYEHGHRLPKAPIYLDSPMAERVLELYPRLVRYFSEEVQAYFLQGKNPFRPRGLRVVESAEESRALAREPGPMVVIAGSGMLTGGRILAHLRYGLSDPKNALVFVGYQPRGGLGAELIARPPLVRILGEEVPLRARVHTLGGFSGHAGQDELLDWLREEPRVLLVHGEEEKLLELGKLLALRGQEVALASLGEGVEV
ncbi:metallo-beta-lactamase family protein [Thermus arciformis]|uniref:Metallo-beta-lactamase family protein n=1 Tax=Thermus arciformis TaxID=482827 RepID=A0A1G7L3Q4_9DEIN|nr:MBL fold metallo-hydrolase [Thermus arciformis]SDF44011.1 metallo-beta-lactamase family protein [Thermus arciformis]